MGRINIGRVVAGGLVAGVVANLLDWVIGRYLMTNEMTDMIQRLNLSVVTVDGSTVTWIVVDLVWGLLLVFTYAAIRPRFGPGPRTAVIAGLTLWLAVSAMFAGLSAMGVYTQQAFIKSSVLSLASTLVPSLIGAAIYQEESPAG